jgi:UDP-glucose 4-epimerase
MHVLLVGGSGFLGGRIARSLTAQAGVSVRVLSRREPAAGWRTQTGVEFIRADVRQRETLRGSCEGVTHVIYLAGLNQAACEERPLEALTVSGTGALHMAEEAARAGVRRFLYISSVKVYGSDGTERLREDLPVNPRTHYGISRQLGEMYCALVAERSGLSVVVLRISNGYGAPAAEEGDCWSVIVNELCRQAVRDGKLVLRSSGRQQRDFIAMRDILAGIDLFLRVPDAGLRHRVFNVGSGASLSLLDVAERVRKVFGGLYGKALPLETGREPVKGQPFHFDIARSREAGFVPRGNMAEEIREIFSACGAPETQ